MLALRTSLALTQRALAERLGTTDTTIRNWERGREKPSAAHYIKMGDIALDAGQSIYFWQAAGIDTDLVARTVAKFGKQIAERERERERPKF